MFELLASIGVIGILMVVFGFVAILWLAKLVDERTDYEESGDDD